MKRIAIALMVCGLAVQGSSADVWKDLARYEYGDESKAGEQVEKLLQQTPVGEYGRLEQKLLAVVASADATQTGKAIACRMLQQVGTKKSIPVVSKLLGDKVLSHYARLVLERLNCEQANKAMRDALEDAPDKLKVGILGSLGECGDKQAVLSAGKLAQSSDAAVAKAAIQALGKIGSKQAAERLASLRPPEKLVPVQMRAMVQCAASLPPEEATALCEEVLAGRYSPCRIAALWALASANPAKASSLIANALKGDDAELRKGALGIVAATKGAALTKAMVALLDELPADRKAALVLALASRGDKAALASATQLIQSVQASVREAAIKAVSKLGDAQTVPILLGMAGSPKLAASIAQAIARMTGDGIDGAVIAALDDRKLRGAAIEAAVARGCTDAVPALLKLLKGDDAATRKHAWAALASLGGEDDMGAIMTAVVAIRNAEELSAAEQAVRKVLSRAKDKSKCFRAIAGRYDEAADGTKGLILQLGALSGGPPALALERKALASGNESLYGKALRALAAWPDEGAAEDLLKLAKTTPEKVDRILALRGYIRIAGLETAKLTGAQRTEMFQTAMAMADRAEEKKQIVSGLQHAISLEGLNLLRKYMADPALRSEATMSAATLIWHLRTSHPAEAAAAAKELLKSKNKTVVEKASKTLADLNKAKLYVRAWLVSDVYRLKGKSAADVHKAAFPPEKDGSDAKWRNLLKAIGKESINLERAIGRADQSCVYVKTTLVCPSQTTARLELGSDDGIKAWLNGKVVHDKWTTRGCRPGEDTAKVRLQEGDNHLMLKVTNESGHWAFSCRVRQENGMPVEGMQVRPE